MAKDIDPYSKVEMELSIYVWVNISAKSMKFNTKVLYLTDTMPIKEQNIDHVEKLNVVTCMSVSRSI